MQDGIGCNRVALGIEYDQVGRQALGDIDFPRGHDRVKRLLLGQGAPRIFCQLDLRVIRTYAHILLDRYVNQPREHGNCRRQRQPEFERVTNNLHYLFDPFLGHVLFRSSYSQDFAVEDAVIVFFEIIAVDGRVQEMGGIDILPVHFAALER